MQSRPIQPPAKQPRDRDEADEDEDAAVFAALTRDECALVIAIANAGGGKGWVRPRGSTLSQLRRLRELKLVELTVDVRGETLCEFTERGRRAVPHALRVRVATGGARGLSL